MSAEVIRWNNWLSTEVQSTKTVPATPIFEVMAISFNHFQASDNKTTREICQLTQRYIIKYIDGIRDPKIKQILSSATRVNFNICQTISITQINVISDEMSARLDNQLKVANSVFRSDLGVNGVYYLHLPVRYNTQNPMILKLPPEDPNQHILADRFLRHFGFVTPHYSAVHQDTPLGMRAYTTLERLGNEYYEQAEENNPLPRQFTQRHYMTVMEMIPGTALSHLHLNDGRALLRDPGILQSIGEIMFLDAFMGNVDRFYQNNLGNCMLLGNNRTDSFGRRLAVIDHDYLLTNSRRASNIEIFKSTVGTNTIIEAVASSLKITYNDEKADPAEIGAHIRAGMVKMREQFLKTFSDDGAIYKLLELPNSPSLGKAEPQYFKEMRDLCLQTTVNQ